MGRYKHSMFFPAHVMGEMVWHPAADIYRAPQGWMLKFDLAGVNPEDVAITVQGRRLTIQGIRRDEVLEQGCSYYRMEISYSKFERTIELPWAVESAHWDFQFRNGMLVIRLYCPEGGPNE